MPAHSANPVLLYALRRATEAAALAAYDWIGRGEKQEGDAAAVEAMREALHALELDGTVVIGEDEGVHVPHLFKGEVFGSGGEFDIAADPIEGTSYMARGQTNAMSVLAVAARGSLFDFGPAFYMEKFAAPAAALGRVDPALPVEDRLAALGVALGKPVSDLTIFVLEKPRHRELVARIQRTGARVAHYAAGDIPGALMAAIPDSGVDALMGTGGVTEGVLSACAARAMGGVFWGRVHPQLQTEAGAVQAAGLDTRRWYAAEEMVRGDAVYFCATGITSGVLIDGVERSGAGYRVQSLLAAAGTGERQLLTTFHHNGSPARLGAGPGQR